MNNDFPTDGPDSVAEAETRPSEEAALCVCSAEIRIEAQKLRQGVIATLCAPSREACDVPTIGRVLKASPSKRSFRWQDGLSRWQSCWAPQDYAVYELTFLDVHSPNDSISGGGTPSV